MAFLILGLISFIGGVFLFRRGGKIGSKEMKFGSFGLVLGGLFLMFLALTLFLTDPVS